MVRIINGLNDLENIINLMKYTERKNRQIPEQMLQDIKRAYRNTTYGMRLKMLEAIRSERILVKYYNVFLEE